MRPGREEKRTPAWDHSPCTCGLVASQTNPLLLSNPFQIGDSLLYLALPGKSSSAFSFCICSNIACFPSSSVNSWIISSSSSSSSESWSSSSSNVVWRMQKGLDTRSQRRRGWKGRRAVYTKEPIPYLYGGYGYGRLGRLTRRRGELTPKSRVWVPFSCYLEHRWTPLMCFREGIEAIQHPWQLYQSQTGECWGCPWDPPWNKMSRWFWPC